MTANTPNGLSDAPPPPVRHRKKRLDIQGLRTLAIVAVVAFHISHYGDKQFFVNGGLGVDIFFIISGYLMGQILSSKPINGPNLLDFYLRRVQRIVPIHCVFLVLTFIAAQCLLLQEDFTAIRTDYLMALGFATNFEAILFGSTSRVSLRHLWSLGVEMQFYLFAPMIIGIIGLLANRASQVHRNCIRLLCLALLTVPSFVVQHFLVTNPAIAFSALHCRLWQFTLGMMAFFVTALFQTDENTTKPLDRENEVDEQNVGNHTAFNSFMNKNGPKWRLRFLQVVSHLIALSLLALLLIVPIRNREALPVDHPFHNDWFYDSQGMVIKMPILLLSAALLVYHAIMDENVQSILLTNPVMVHFGDTSYVLYLVHYPVLRLVKYHFEIAKYGIWDGIAVFVASVVLSELLHWLIDSHFRAIRSRKVALKLLVCLYILCGLLLLPTYFEHQNDVPTPSSQQNLTQI